MPSMQPDPSADVQVGASGGPWILWEPERPSARREGLLCTLEISPVDGNVTEPDAWLDVQPIDTGLEAVHWDDRGVRTRWVSRGVSERAPARLWINMTLARAGTDDPSTFARDLAGRLGRLLRPPLLERLHEACCEANGLATGMVARLPDHWAPGQHAPWQDLWRTVPLELVEVGHKHYIALDDHCPLPGCMCMDAIIQFVEFEIDLDPPVAHRRLGGVRVKPDGRWDVIDATGGITLVDAWHALEARYGDVPRELERRRRTVRTLVGEEASRRTQSSCPSPSSAVPSLSSSPPVPAASGVSKLGRNAPCLCGSGRKYKRCHGR